MIWVCILRKCLFNKHSLLKCSICLQNKHCLQGITMLGLRGRYVRFRLIENFWDSMWDNCNSLLMQEFAVKISLWSLAPIIWPTFGSRFVSRLLRAIDSVHAISACFSLTVKFRLLIAANVFAWCVWSLAENVKADSFDSCLNLWRFCVSAERSLGSPKWFSNRVWILSNWLGFREFIHSDQPCYRQYYKI